MDTVRPRLRLIAIQEPSGGHHLLHVRKKTESLNKML